MKDKEKRHKFQYRKRNPDEMRKRATQKGGMYETPFSDDYPLFTPAVGDNTIRILPPTWEDARHYGFDVYVHSRIGADSGTLTCPARNQNKSCPVCDEIDRMKKDGEDKELIQSLYPTKRVVMLIIDRDREKEGPKLWPCPWTLDKNIASLAFDKKRNMILSLDDPEEGYDVSFTREGKDRTTKYIAIQIDRSPTPLSDDEAKAAKWLSKISKTTVLDCITWHTTEQLEKALAGLSNEKDSSKKPKREKLEENDDDEEDELDDDELPADFK